MPRKKKQAKPYCDFPLFLHASGQWAKKIRGRTHYFGKDAEEARDKYLKQREDLQAGRVPRVGGDGMTVRDLVNRFLTSKRALVDTGELSPRTWSDYYSCCERLTGTLGKTRTVGSLAGDDFERHRARLAKNCGPVALGNEIQRVRSLFKFAWEEGLIEKPVRFGTQFKKPARKVIRKARLDAGPRMIEAADIRRLLKAAGTPMKAMILLGINCAFGQTDVATLPKSALDLKAGWVNYPRPKTAIPRRCPLWPETVKALKEALAVRPKAKDHEDTPLVFITKYGKRWVRGGPRLPAAVPTAR